MFQYTLDPRSLVADPAQDPIGAHVLMHRKDPALMSKKDKNVVKVKAVTTISEENHRQIFARLSDPIFNTGAMHGTPGQRKGKSN